MEVYLYVALLGVIIGVTTIDEVKQVNVPSLAAADIKVTVGVVVFWYTVNIYAVFVITEEQPVNIFVINNL